MVDKLKTVAKALVPVALAVLYAIQAALTGDNEITTDEWRGIVGLLISAALVWLVPNKPAVEP